MANGTLIKASSGSTSAYVSNNAANAPDFAGLAAGFAIAAVLLLS